MNKREILAELTAACAKYGIPKHVVIISYGAASVILGTKRHTKHVDVSIPKAYSDRLKDEGLTVRVADSDPGEIPPVEIISDGTIEFLCTDPFGRKEFNECEGFRIVTPKQLILDRIKIGRKKDMDDVAKLIYHPAVRRLLDEDEVELVKALFRKHSM